LSIKLHFSFLLKFVLSHIPEFVYKVMVNIQKERLLSKKKNSKFEYDKK